MEDMWNGSGKHNEAAWCESVRKNKENCNIIPFKDPRLEEVDYRNENVWTWSPGMVIWVFLF